LTQQATLRDPTDLLIMKPDVHWSQLRQYRMGLTSEADLVDLRAMDTAEDVIVRFVITGKKSVITNRKICP